jgi:hypothetical protein
MKKVIAPMLLLALLAFAAGCSTGAGGSKTTTACAPKDNAVTICLNGKPIDFSAEKTQPHKHENGNLYAPVVALSNALGVKVEADAANKTVTVNGKKIEVASSAEVKGIHVHENAVFVPLKQFAEAAGLKYEMDWEKGVAGFAK